MTYRNGAGNYVLRSLRDGRYIGREPDGGTPARLCWPSRLNRHVMHFGTSEDAQRYIDEGKTGFRPSSPHFEPHKIVHVRAIRRTP